MPSARAAQVIDARQAPGAHGRPIRARLLVPGLIGLYLFLLVLPVVAAYLQGLPPRKWQDDLSSSLAMCAFSGLLIEFVLSGRFRFVSSHIGIDTTMRIHQLMARALTLFILVHPFLYVSAPRNYPMPWDTTRQLSIDFGPTAILTGLGAWLALLVIVLMAIFREQRAGSYEAWRLSHGIGASLVAVFGTVHALQAGRYSEQPFLAWFWTVMLALALFTLLWVYLLKPAWQLRQPYKVRSVRKIAQRTWELVAEPRNGQVIDFKAGQFVWLNVGHSPFSLNENPFSIASAPTTRNHLAFVIKEVGDFTRRLGDIMPGTIAFVDGPHGNMTIERRRSSGIALYAGGVGIAPMLAILRQLRDNGDPRPIVLLYANRCVDQIVYRDELDEMCRQLDLRIEHFLSEPPQSWTGRRGLIDRDALHDTFAGRGPTTWLHVICGPMAMIENIEAALLAMGVPSRQIISERFYYD